MESLQLQRAFSTEFLKIGLQIISNFYIWINML